MKQIFYNGEIVTMEQEGQQFSAMMIEDDHIVALGSNFTIIKDLLHNVPLSTLQDYFSILRFASARANSSNGIIIYWAFCSKSLCS